MKPLHLFFLFFFCLCAGFFIDTYNRSSFHIAVLDWWPNDPDPQNTSTWKQPLSDYFAKHRYKLEQESNTTIQKNDLVLVAYPNPNMSNIPTENLYIWALESPISLSQPLPAPIVAKAKKIFTWRKDLVDNKKIFYLPIVTRLTEKVTLNTDLSLKKLLLIQISGNYYYGDIYQERRNAVAWFLQNHPQDLEFYGAKWNELKKDLPDSLHPYFDTQYKRYAPDKIASLRTAKFALAYENTIHPDYVTEKIYDVMKAGTVPIYLGAPNITEYVPKKCFINKADFPTYESLYTFLKNMPDTQYIKYLTCIQTFLHSDKINELTGDYAAKRIVDVIFNTP